MRRRGPGEPDDDDDDLEHDDDDDQNGDDDDEDENGDDDEGDDEVEDAAAVGAPSAPDTASIPFTATAPAAARDTAGRFVGRRARRPFLEPTDPRLVKLDLRKYEYNPELQKNAERYVRAYTPPFPALAWTGFLTVVRDAYGPGRYRIVQYGVDGYLGARTFDLTHGIPRVTADLGAAPNGNGASYAPPPPPPAAAMGMDFKTALVIHGIPALIAGLTQLAHAIQPRPAETLTVEKLLEVVKLTSVSNQERAQTFRDAMELMNTMQPPAGGGGEGGGSIGDLSQLATAAAQILTQLKGNTPGQGVQPAPGTATGNPPPALIAGLDSKVDPARAFESMMVAEIDRAVRTGDEPECLCMLLETWLDPLSMAWLVNTDEEEVLRELPMRYTTHAEFMKREPVQQFLRRALAMLREDSNAEGTEDERDTASEPAGAVQ